MRLNDWRVERFFPQAVALTSLQGFLIASNLILVGIPVLENVNLRWGFMTCWGFLGLVFLSQSNRILGDLFKRFNIPYRAARHREKPFQIVPGIATTTLALLIFLFLIGWKVFAIRIWQI